MKSFPYYVKAVAMGIPAYLVGVHLWTWVLMSGFYLGGHSDFRVSFTPAVLCCVPDTHMSYTI